VSPPFSVGFVVDGMVKVVTRELLPFLGAATRSASRGRAGGRDPAKDEQSHGRWNNLPQDQANEYLDAENLVI